MVKEKQTKVGNEKQKLKKTAGFYHYDNGVPKIIHFELIKFLGKNGFGNMNIGGATRLVRIVDNIVSDVSEGDLSCFIRNYLISIKELDVLEVFVRGIGGYLNRKKYELLPKVKGISDKDPKDCAWLYFKNTAVKVNETDIVLVPYEKLPHKIWANRIIHKDFNLVNFNSGQFNDFCFKLSKEDPERFKALKATLGYLLHRHNNPAVCKVVIFLDENATKGGPTNGGTGKSLLSKALSHCVETVLMDGKNMKRDSRFNNQRISNTTDIVCFDDVDSKFSLELLYSMATSGFVIEKKGKEEFTLKAEESPKIIVSSNSPVSGPGGSSDIRRRHEFEIPNYFSEKLTPKMVYKNLFFDDWDENEWNCFFSFMIDCIQFFLKEGLLEAKPLKLKVNKFTQRTSTEFHDFTLNGFLSTGIWIEKKDIFKKFIDSYPHLKEISSHMLTKWIKRYAEENQLQYKDKKTGGKYEFKLIITNDDDDANE
ncbi:MULTISPECIES: primase-helicase family protein [unclassified Flavobacterium]|uniref:primase-helicase family protein n=1 Tax=unclassified Flavobacterium TaxID=196869 RepID=UPI00131E7371|nr:primase-helicase family protein [Flavobacterium sp. I-STPP5a]